MRVVFREPFAESLSTFTMVLFGNASVAQALLSAGVVCSGNEWIWAIPKYQLGIVLSLRSFIYILTKDIFLTSANRWGLGVMFGIYDAGNSGGFLNPSITLCFCLYRKLPWRCFSIYFLAQFLGGFCNSGVVYANYINAINSLEGHGICAVPPSKAATTGIFCTCPQAFMTKASQFFSEFIASTILIFVIFALKDNSNPGVMGKSGTRQLFPLALLFLGFGFVLPSPILLVFHSTPYYMSSQTHKLIKL